MNAWRQPYIERGVVVFPLCSKIDDVPARPKRVRVTVRSHPKPTLSGMSLQCSGRRCGIASCRQKDNDTTVLGTLPYQYCRDNYGSES